VREGVAAIGFQRRKKEVGIWVLKGSEKKGEIEKRSDIG